MASKPDGHQGTGQTIQSVHIPIGPQTSFMSLGQNAFKGALPGEVCLGQVVTKAEKGWGSVGLGEQW